MVYKYFILNWLNTLELVLSEVDDMVSNGLNMWFDLPSKEVLVAILYFYLAGLALCLLVGNVFDRKFSIITNEYSHHQRRANPYKEHSKPVKALKVASYNTFGRLLAPIL